ncbi:MAG: DUF4179 domain-containing protein [Anaerovoracaceae bacterium]
MSDNRNQWYDLIKESHQYPEGLAGVEHRLEKRIIKKNRKRKALYSSLTAVAAVFIFMILVNTSPAFASGVSQIPLIGKLAEVVKFDKSISNAIKNDYIQEVNLTARDGEERLQLPYVLADEKNLVLFFQLPEELEQTSNEWVNITLQEMRNGFTGEVLDGFSYSMSSLSLDGREEKHGFLMQRYHFIEGNLPKKIQLDVAVDIETIGGLSQEQRVGEPTNGSTKPNLKRAGVFSYEVDFKEFSKPKIYEFNENYSLYGQQIKLENMKVYPAGTEVNFSFPKENTAWIKGLYLTVEQDGEVSLEGNNGISSTQDDEKGWMRVFIESNYFDPPSKQELIIQGIRLLNKDEEYVTIDINEKTITPQIAGTELVEVTKQGEKAQLVFSTKVADNDGFGMFNFEYQDLEGNVNSLDEEGSSVIGTQMETRITVEYPTSGKIILQRALTPKQILKEPIRISLPLDK